jgi:hypothetical protein
MVPIVTLAVTPRQSETVATKEYVPAAKPEGTFKELA